MCGAVTRYPAPPLLPALRIESDMEVEEDDAADALATRMEALCVCAWAPDRGESTDAGGGGTLTPKPAGSAETVTKGMTGGLLQITCKSGARHTGDDVAK